MKLNPVTLADGYKFGHRPQYPTGTQAVQSNWTARGSRLAGVDRVPLILVQPFCQRYLMDELEPFFKGDIEEICDKYARRMNGYFGPNIVGTDHIRAWHKLGYTPLRISAVPEGALVPIRVPSVIIENTIDEFYWLTNFYETLFSTSVWLGCTSAAQALRLRRLFNTFAAATGSPPEFTSWQGHDFSFRGMGSLESACFSGTGHLLAFTGTDTVPALDFIEQYYGVPDNYILGGSVPATEHSVMCAGLQEQERDTFERLMKLYPSGILSVVSDTWDLWKVITEILPALKDQIMARDGKLVIRPDSGDPVKIVCGDPGAPAGSPQSKGVIQLLYEIFGGTKTSTGHILLDSHIGCIYGDAINYARAEAILASLESKGFASANIVFGVGSYTYQYVTRDFFSFAVKATWTKRDGQGYDLFKSPVTDDGMKNSAKGRLAVLRNPAGELELINGATPEQEAQSIIRPMWENGKFLVRETWDVIRARALAQL